MSNVPLLINAVNVSRSVKNCFNLAGHGDFGDALNAVGDIGKNILHFVGFGWAVHEILTLAQRDDLKTRQKIVPMIGYGLTAAVSLTTGIIVCVGALALLPPLMFAASVVNVVRNIGVYLKEKAERKNLRKQFADLEAINHAINQFDLPDKIRYDFREFIKKPHFDAHKIQELYVRIGNHFINKTAKQQQELSELILHSKIENISPQEKRSLRAKIKMQEKSLKKQFNEEYGGLFTLLEKKQQLHRREKSVNVRFKSIFISLGVAVVSLLAFVVPLALLATPAAPVAPLVYKVLAGVGAAIGAVGAAVATKLSWQESKSRAKAEQPKEDLRKAVYPKLQESDYKQENQKRVNILYKRSLWSKVKDKLSSLWKGLFAKKELANAAVDETPSAIKKGYVKTQVSAFENKSEKMLREDTPLQVMDKVLIDLIEKDSDKENKSKDKRAHYVAQFKASSTNTTGQPLILQAVHLTPNVPPKRTR